MTLATVAGVTCGMPPGAYSHSPPPICPKLLSLLPPPRLEVTELVWLYPYRLSIALLKLLCKAKGLTSDFSASRKPCGGRIGASGVREGTPGEPSALQSPCSEPSGWLDGLCQAGSTGQTAKQEGALGMSAAPHDEASALGSWHRAQRRRHAGHPREATGGHMAHVLTRK